MQAARAAEPTPRPAADPRSARPSFPRRDPGAGLPAGERHRPRRSRSASFGRQGCTAATSPVAAAPREPMTGPARQRSMASGATVPESGTTSTSALSAIWALRSVGAPPNRPLAAARLPRLRRSPSAQQRRLTSPEPAAGRDHGAGRRGARPIGAAQLGEGHGTAEAGQDDSGAEDSSVGGAGSAFRRRGWSGMGSGLCWWLSCGGCPKRRYHGARRTGISRVSARLTARSSPRTVPLCG